MTRNTVSHLVLAASLLGAAACDSTNSDIVAPLSPRYAGFSEQARSLTFSENFTLKNGAVPARLEATGGTPVYTNGTVVFEEFRTYLRTIANYSATSFKADVTVSVLSPANPDGIAFIGFGVGEPDCGFFCEPAAYPSVYARLLPDGFHGGGIDVSDYTGIGDYTGFINGQGGTGTHRVRITWNASTREVTFGIHSDYVEGAEFNPTTVYGPAAVGSDLDMTNSRIFIGGALNATFDNLRVVVTPK